MSDFIPSSDDAFDNFINVDLGPAVNNAGTPLQLTPAQITAFNAKQTDWVVAWLTALLGR